MNDKRFHRYGRRISPEEIPQKMNDPFDYEPHSLCIEAAEAVRRHVQSSPGLSRSASSGKMFGVLAVMSEDGETGFLAAFSGLLDNTNDEEYFVPAVYDMLKPEDFFRQAEKQIATMTGKIRLKQKDDDLLLQKIALRTEELMLELQRLEEGFALRRASRHKILDNPSSSESVREAVIAESQREKSLYRKEKSSIRQKIQELDRTAKEAESETARLIESRKSFSAGIQKEIFSRFVMLSEKGDRADLNEIFSHTPLKNPPAGAGECAAPKLLQYAFANRYRPLAIAEFWIGEPPESLVRKDGQFYPACSGKCGPILEFMLKDTETVPFTFPASDADISCMDILYEDSHVIAVSKPSGVLSVPGRDGNAISVSEAMGLEAIHRLDMDTSGILLLAKDSTSLSAMRKLFEEGKCRKEYTALLEGRYGQPGLRGRISLPLMADYLNRPMQRVDTRNGKEAVTEYEVISSGEKSTRIMLFPRTGRTHQLRVHCAHKNGLGHAICGDRLYGTRGERMFLHASRITYRDPFSGKETDIICSAPF